MVFVGDLQDCEGPERLTDGRWSMRIDEAERECVRPRSSWMEDRAWPSMTACAIERRKVSPTAGDGLLAWNGDWSKEYRTLYELA